MNDSEFQEVREISGARAFEEWLDGPYKEKWHQVWQEGRLARQQNKSREKNPYSLKVWKAVWEYGWDNYDPNSLPQEFARMEDYIDRSPTRPCSVNDL